MTRGRIVLLLVAMLVAACNAPAAAPSASATASTSATGTATASSKPPAASVVVAGLPYAHAYKSLKWEAGAMTGTAQGQTKRIHGVTLMLLDSGSFEIGPDEPRLKVVFYKSQNGKEPVRDWLKFLPIQDKKAIGGDIKTVQFGWPLGMPLVRKLEPGLWEVRSSTSSGIARLLFTVQGEFLVLLHGIVKKSAKTPLNDLSLARKRLAQVRGEG